MTRAQRIETICEQFEQAADAAEQRKRQRALENQLRRELDKALALVAEQQTVISKLTAELAQARFVGLLLAE